MGDTISRAAAVELAMCYYPDDDGTCSKSGEDLRDLLDDLESLPSTEPDREKIDEYLLKIWCLEHPLSSNTATVELRWWIKKIYEEIYGEGEKPIWMT